MNIFRLHIRPKGGDQNKNEGESFNYCLEGGLLGMGWQSNSQSNSLDWEGYKKSALENGYTERQLASVKYLKKHVKKGSLIWTRDATGIYYLGKVLSSWEYCSNEIARRVDIVNIVRCELKEIKIDDVPGKVIACFRPARTIQAIRDKTASDYSMYLWNKLTSMECYPSLSDKFENVFSFLDAEETEDVVSIYLQTKGWIVIPNSRKIDTMGYEFYLIHKDTKERSIVQVKTGGSRLNSKKEEWGKWTEKVFLFQSNNLYDDKKFDNVECIEPEIIKQFMNNNRNLLPSKIVHWMDMAEK